MYDKMSASLQEDLTCPVCADIFKDPVVLSCSHSVCNVCVQQYWETTGSRQCPVCKSNSADTPTASFALKNLCELYLKEKGQSRGQCKLHKMHFELFCYNDKELVCQSCEDSKVHKHHKCTPIDRAATDVKEELMVKLQAKLKDYEQTKEDCHKTILHIKTQSKQTEKQIKRVFAELHQFLRDEEKARIAALREDEKLKSLMMKKQIEKMNTEITSLPVTIRVIKEEMTEDDLTFLQNYRKTVERVQCTLQDPERFSSALINVAKHLGNLKFRVWEKMQEIVRYSPIVLDPNTAYSGLVLSEDLTSVRRIDERQQLPDNPERFDRYLTVLGPEGFMSGTHSWEVEVGANSCWSVGVLTETVQRKGECASKRGQWFFWHKDGKYWVCSTPKPSAPLQVRHRLRRIRVQLDWDRGELAFSDPDHNTYLYTITHAFTERVFPSFSIGGKHVPLSITPLKTSVRVEQAS